MNSRQYLPLLLLLILCSAMVRAASAQDPKGAPIVITTEMIGARYPPMKLRKQTKSESYGYTEAEPILIGGGFSDGSKRIYSFLNALRGPEGQKVHYDRIGSCCAFDTPKAAFGGRGLLEHYEITYDGLEEPKDLYFNWYDAQKPLIPVGLTASP